MRVHAIELRGVAMEFANGTMALDGIDLAVDAGEIVGVVGPSGCGKTTLLRIVAGLQRCTSGRLTTRVDGIGYVFQDPTLLPWRTVRGNVEIVAQLHGMPRRERRRRAEQAIAQVGLDGFAEYHPHQLSGGMRMRAALAQALLPGPKLVLFDEPFGALDELTRDRLCDQLQLLHLAEQFTAVFVTHSIAEAVFVSHRVLVMSPRPGRLRAEIPVPLRFPRTPEVRYTAAFADVSREVARPLRNTA
jgi:NitT/TauT family transport system ATP-binding protein